MIHVIPTSSDGGYLFLFSVKREKREITRETIHNPQCVTCEYLLNQSFHPFLILSNPHTQLPSYFLHQIIAQTTGEIWILLDIINILLLGVSEMMIGVIYDL